MAEMTTTLTGFAAATIEKKRAAEAVQEGAQAATGTAEYTFDVSHMDLFYNEFQALKDINMKIRKNEITALIGPSGCGKSTFLKTLNRMNDWVEGCRVTGDIRFEGKDIFKEVDPLALRYRVGMVFQQPIAFPHSIEKNLTYVLKYYGIRDKKVLSEKVEESLKKAKLYEEVKDQLKKSALKLSGGQKQRLAIARSLCVNPEILLLDEPCSALDMKNTIAIEETLMELKGQYTFVIVTHNLGQAKRIADQIIFMDQGKILEVTDKGTFFDSPATELAREQIQYM